MNKAFQLNQYATITTLQQLKEKNQRTITWIENELFPYLERIANQGDYCCCLPKAQGYAKDNDYFAVANCPKNGVNIDLMTEILIKNGFYVENNSIYCFVSWDSKYIY